MTSAHLVENSGECIVFLGPMFSGKTTRLLSELTACADIDIDTLYINHVDDIRTTEKQDSNVSTHNSSFRGLSDKVTKVRTSKLSDINVDDYTVIGIDEAQWFGDLEITVRQWVIKQNKIVYIASLDGDYQMKPFGQIKELISIWTDVHKLKSRCVCCLKNSNGTKRNLACFTGRLATAGPMSGQKDVGGADKYLPLCMACHKENRGIK